MRRFCRIWAAALMLVACSQEEGAHIDVQGFSYDDDDEVGHGMIVLGDKLDNPYVTETVQQAFVALYPTKSREVVSTTDLYVRFLPVDEDQFNQLTNLGVEMLDHPMDYEIVEEGDYYHDPELEDESITWQYAVVATDFEFPEDITYEILDECFISDDADEETKAMAGVDWDAVEAEAYRITGNEDMLDAESLTKSTKYHPAGRITIVDAGANGGQPFGVAGVKISCNSFVKFTHTYTDRDGYYEMPKKYSSKVRYRLVFKNTLGFKIGFNLILVPASVCSLGKHTPQGYDYTVTTASSGKLFRRAVVNNAAYDYYTRCAEDDMDLLTPPSDLRIWIFKNISASSAVMIHHGAIISKSIFKKYLGIYAMLIKFFAPDITIGAKNHTTYADLYDSTVHELSHASHFNQVGTDYWDDYITYIASSYLSSGGETYGDGSGDHAGNCEVGEMWAYYMESMMHKERYGGDVPAYGTSFWFYPQIFRYLDEKGITRSQIFAALQKDVTDRTELENALISLYPEQTLVIEQAFNRYQ